MDKQYLFTVSHNGNQYNSAIDLENGKCQIIYKNGERVQVSSQSLDKQEFEKLLEIVDDMTDKLFRDI